MAWIWAALMPHPPIMIPEVGRGQESLAAATLAGARAIAQNLAARPDGGRVDGLLILSPHQPYAPGALFLNAAERLEGSLERFRAPEVRCRLQTSPTWSDLARHLTEAGVMVATRAAPNLTPDHSAMVPLYFLARALNPIPPVIVASPIGLSPAAALALGQALAKWSPGPGAAWALLASGDLSHRLTRSAPAGFNPEGQIFDREVVAALTAGDPRTLLANWPPDRLDSAGECGFRSVLALMGLTGGPVQVLSYEGPFGVGYANAWWTSPAEG
ncbi:MAG: hypothetical protein LBP55_06805 [Candidatus Adiutrix sp.]|jgi:aromatic ring-opening dioxygenase LigB subunit|nr:hypothetical protein [Candidatus Adiutrix sp.]